MRLNIDGNPEQISQLLRILSWIESTKSLNHTCEFKVRINSTDLSFTALNPEINKQMADFKSIYSGIDTNPIFYIGDVFK